MAAGDVDNNCESVNYSFGTATISARFGDNQFVPYKTSGSSVFLATHKLRVVTVAKYPALASMTISDSTKTHRFVEKIIVAFISC